MFLFTYLGYYIFNRFNLLGNIVQLLLLSVTTTNVLSALFYMHTVYIYMLCCICMTISISLDLRNVKINYNYKPTQLLCCIVASYAACSALVNPVSPALIWQCTPYH